MELEPHLFNLLPKLAETGSCTLLQGCYALQGFEKGPRTFVLDDGISYELTLTNTGAAVLITGSIEASASSECDRCLETAYITLAGEVDGYAAFEALPPDIKEEIDDYILTKGSDATIDLAPLLYSALILAVPLMVICQEDCAGICPSCGVNLNEGPCTCDHDPVDKNHPFAALKDLL